MLEDRLDGKTYQQLAEEFDLTVEDIKHRISEELGCDSAQLSLYEDVARIDRAIGGLSLGVCLGNPRACEVTASLVAQRQQLLGAVPASPGDLRVGSRVRVESPDVEAEEGVVVGFRKSLVGSQKIVRFDSGYEYAILETDSLYLIQFDTESEPT